MHLLYVLLCTCGRSCTCRGTELCSCCTWRGRLLFWSSGTKFSGPETFEKCSIYTIYPILSACFQSVLLSVLLMRINVTCNIRDPCLKASFKYFSENFAKEEVRRAVCDFQLSTLIYHSCLATTPPSQSPSAEVCGSRSLSSSSSVSCNTTFNWIGNRETGSYITVPTRDIFLSL